MSLQFDDIHFEGLTVQAQEFCNFQIPYQKDGKITDIDVLFTADLIHGDWDVEITNFNGVPEFELTQEEKDEIHDIVKGHAEVG